jgi:hypothetical protein
MAPSYLIFREKQEEFLSCNSVKSIIDVYNSGSVVSYNPDWVISELRELVKDIFVTGAERF